MNRIQFYRIFVLMITIFWVVLKTQAAGIKYLTTYSQSMEKDIGVVVITPENYSPGIQYPVMYLLHGYSGDEMSWITKVPEIRNYADLYHFIIVCPDGDYSSWYFDSPVDPNMKYETYISNELVSWVDNNYSTIKSKEGRAITGFSMGGHGALYIAICNQDVFGAAGSMSGGVDIRPFPSNWEISERLGGYSENPENWERNTIINMVYKLQPGSLKIIFDCGRSDFFYEVNCQLHEKLLDRNIPHDFIVRPGGHTWEYWTNSIAYQALFFHNFFDLEE